MKVRKIYLKFKLGKHSLTIERGDNISYVTGLVSSLLGLIIISNIMRIVGYYNFYLFFGLWFIFSFTILIRFEKSIDKMIRTVFIEVKK